MGMEDVRAGEMVGVRHVWRGRGVTDVWGGWRVTDVRWVGE